MSQEPYRSPFPTDLTEANLQGADLSYADLTNAILVKANLKDTDLTGTILTNADLRETIMPDGTIYGKGN